MSSSSVVLPAPFFPSTPTTSPGATPHEMSGRTGFIPNSLLRFDASTVALFIVLLPFLADRLHDLRLAQLKLFAREHELLDQGPDVLQPFRRQRVVPRLAGDRHRHSAMTFEQPFRLEQA